MHLQLVVISARAKQYNKLSPALQTEDLEIFIYLSTNTILVHKFISITLYLGTAIAQSSRHHLVFFIFGLQVVTI